MTTFCLGLTVFIGENTPAQIRFNRFVITERITVGGGLTVWEETIEDAILATEILRADPRIDPNRIYILGHSLGGMLAPRIHIMGGNYAGLSCSPARLAFCLIVAKQKNNMLPREDLNPHKQIQRLLCYPYTTGERIQIHTTKSKGTCQVEYKYFFYLYQALL